MRAVLVVELLSDAGVQTFLLPMASNGAPILPSKGDSVRIGSILCTVEKIGWFLDLEEPLVEVHAKER